MRCRVGLEPEEPGPPATEEPVPEPCQVTNGDGKEKQSVSTPTGCGTFASRKRSAVMINVEEPRALSSIHFFTFWINAVEQYGAARWLHRCRLPPESQNNQITLIMGRQESSLKEFQRAQTTWRNISGYVVEFQHGWLIACSTSIDLTPFQVSSS